MGYKIVEIVAMLYKCKYARGEIYMLILERFIIFHIIRKHNLGVLFQKNLFPKYDFLIES